MRLDKICIIPALGKNVYSPKGDLESWGGSTLLEWKISQAKEANVFDKIIISSPSSKVISLAKKKKIHFIKRNDKDNLDKLYRDTAKKFKNSTIVFLSVTFPFISPLIIKNFLSEYAKSDQKSGFTYIKKNEYYYYKNKPLNFNIDQYIKSRRDIPFVKKIVPGIIAFNSNNLIKNKNIFQSKNFFHKIKWLDSLEVNTPIDLNIFNLLILEYFKKKKN
jgi:CMP-N-acetylneuraminic acid synthetase